MADLDLKIKATADTAGATKGVDDITAALERAKSNTEGFAAVADSKLPGVEVVFKSAEGAVGALATAIDRAKAAGSPIPPDAEAKLQAFQAVLKGTAPALDDHAKGTQKASAATAEFKSLIPLASRELGPFGSALNQLSKSNNEWIAGLAKGLIPIAAVGGAIAVLGKAMEGLKERGLQLPGVTDVMGEALDRVALAFGGTTKAMNLATQSLGEAQAKFLDLDPAARALADGLALLAAAGVSVNEVATGFKGSLGDLSTDLGRSEAAARDWGADVRQQVDLANAALNKIRVTSPALAADLTRDFEKALQAVRDHVDGSVPALNRLTAQYVSLGGVAEANLGTIKNAHKDLGDKTGPEVTKFTQTIESLRGHLSQISGQITNDKAYEVLKGEVAAVVAGMSIFNGDLSHLGATEKETALKALELAKAHDPLQAAFDAAAKKTIQIGTDMNRLNTIIQENSGSVESQQRAIRALLPDIEKQISLINAQRDSQGNLSVSNQALLDAANAWLQTINKLNPAIEESRNKVSDYDVKLGGLGKRFEDLTKAYERQRAQVELTAKSQIANAERAAAAVSASVGQEIASLNQSELGNAAYFAKINELQGKKIDAARDAQEKVEGIQSDEASKLEELQTAYGESTAEIRRTLGLQGETIESARAIHANLAKQAKITSAELVTEANRHADLAVSMSGVFGGVDGALKSLSKNGGGLDLVKKALGEVTGQANSTAGALQVVIDRLGQISISNTGGAGQDSSGQPLSAPGGET